jgi:LysM repeat protein
MQRWKRLFYYLLLNVIVSACTTFAVLMLWERSNDALPGNLSPSMALELLLPSTATPPPPEETPEPQATPTESFTVYQVTAGETFESIAEDHSMSVDELIAVNGFTESQTLGDGEVLLIPLHPKGSVIIDSVIGAGDINSEKVLLKHRGEGELSLVGWQIGDSRGHEFTFPQSPQLTLFKNGAVYIHTKNGTNTVVDLFWGLNSPVWQSGDSVVLKDPQGLVRARYTIP